MSNAKVNQKVDNLSDYKGITIVAQQTDGKLHRVSLELLGEGRRLADKLGCPLTAFVMGHSIDEVAAKLATHGANTVVKCDDPQLKHYSTEGYTTAVAQYIEAYKPEAVLYGATSFGRDFAPRVAARIGTGLTADCTSMDVDAETRDLLQTRPAFGGNLMATIICPRNRPQMATIRPGVMLKAEKDGETAEIIDFKATFDDKMKLVTLLNTVVNKSKSVPLADADVVVSGGRGVGSAENFALLQQLADKLGGVVGASRAAVDSGFISAPHQVGQTGAMVRPTIYIACGISGAIQHMIGMQDSDIIIAINKNPDAPIMSCAHLALVGDLNTVIPELIAEIDRGA